MRDPYSGALVLVYSTRSLTDGYLARGLLEANGIPVIVKGEGEGPYRMGPAHLWVPEELEVQARMVIAEVRLGQLQDEGSRGETEEDTVGRGEAETAPD